MTISEPIGRSVLASPVTVGLISAAPLGGNAAGAVTEAAAAGRSIADRSVADRLNWLRAGVLGANDGIVSTAALILGFAGAASSRSAILLAGLLGLLAGAMSMAVGEYVSVSAQRDAESSMLQRRSDELVKPTQAAVASFVSFVIGAAIPLLGAVISPVAWVAVAAVTIALAITGSVSARLGRSPVRRAVVRNVLGGLIAMAVTFGLGHVVGALF